MKANRTLGSELSHVSGVAATLLSDGQSVRTLIEWRCRRGGYLRDVVVGETPATEIMLVEFTLLPANGERCGLIDAVKRDTTGPTMPHEEWDGGVNLACFAETMRAYGSGWWVRPMDVIQIRAMTRSSYNIEMDLGLVFTKRAPVCVED